MSIAGDRPTTRRPPAASNRPCVTTLGMRSVRCASRPTSRLSPSLSSRLASAPAPPSSPSSMRSSCAGCRSTSTIGWWRCSSTIRGGPPRSGVDRRRRRRISTGGGCRSRSRRSPAPAVTASCGCVTRLASQSMAEGCDTHEFFQVFRVTPMLGRAFTAEDEIDGRHRVVILSYGYWQRRFGGSPEVIGKRIEVNDQTLEIVGVMPRQFAYGNLPIPSASSFRPRSTGRSHSPATTKCAAATGTTTGWRSRG
jgi:hypothetical protein